MPLKAPDICAQCKWSTQIYDNKYYCPFFPCDKAKSAEPIKPDASSISPDERPEQSDT